VNGLVYAKLLLTAIFWGGTFIAGRVIADDVKPFSAAFSRFALASVLLLLTAWHAEGKLPPIRRRQIIPIILLGMTGIFAYNFFFFNGIKLLAASRASVIVASNPVFITLLSALFFKERLNLVRVGGLVISLAGALFVISRGHPSEILAGHVGLGELYIFGCVLSWVIYSLIGKVIMADLTPLVSVSYSSLVGAIALLLPAYFEGFGQDLFHYSALTWIGISYLALCGTVLGFRWYYEGIQHIGPAKAGIFINFVPISGVLLAFFLLGEPITPSLLTGTVLVSSGVYLANTAASRRVSKPPRPPKGGSKEPNSPRWGVRGAVFEKYWDKGNIHGYL
jgi:drug/metabolite transporter (DMT)-like permease